MTNRITTNQLNLNIQRNTRSQLTLPSFENGSGHGRILTNHPPVKTDEEFKQAIKEQARRDFEEGRFQTGQEYDLLKDNFVSVVSPDRQSVIQNAMRTHSHIFSRLRIINLPLDQPRGQTPIHFSHTFESTGKSISTIQLTNYGWDFSKTQAEAQRGLDFRLIYNEAWQSARNEAKAENRQFDSKGFVIPLGNRIDTTPSPQHVATQYENMRAE